MDAKEEENSLGPNWLELPRDVTSMILKKLDDLEILLSARQVCSLWWNICKDPLMWRTIHLMSDNSVHLPCPFDDICCYAIDRSCGHLEDIDIGDNGSDYLLKYIYDSTSQLRCLRLGDRNGRISDEGLVEVVDKLQLLEALEFSACFLSKVSLEAIGRCCPRLTVLKFKSFFLVSEDVELLFAIAKNMPQLRHLHFFGYNVSHAALFVILDGCLHLDSLYLGGFKYFVFDESLQKKCVQRNIDLRFVGNSIDESFRFLKTIPLTMNLSEHEILFRVNNVNDCDY